MRASVSHEALEAARIEAGYPIFGVDMTDDTIPLEAGIEDRAISMTKGCYVGQEVIIRVLHRGHGRVARKLVALRIDGLVPERGARLFAADRDVGFRHQRSGVAATRHDRDGLRASRLRRDWHDDRGRGRFGPRACHRYRTADSVRSLISSSSAGGKPSVARSARGTHRISWPSSGRGVPRSVHR